MRETRVPLTEIKPGEMIVRIGSREIGARFVALHDMAPGTLLRGPRGGLYRSTVHGARERVVVETYVGRPIVNRSAMATVLRASQED